jgi:hypothetical protein
MQSIVLTICNSYFILVKFRFFTVAILHSPLTIHCMNSKTQKNSVREKIGFSLGDGAAATLFLVARLWGAVADPIMGAIGDRTNFSRAFFSSRLTSLLIVQCSRIRAGVICALQ